jgi:aminoglycoside phosphotransferase family enzyme/predicted kinase
MNFQELIAALTDPGAYPFPVASVEVRQTHISAVFLAGAYAYKVKKPADLGFLDFTTLERRRHDCDEEVRLNRRLAPRVYLGVVPVTRAGAALAVEGAGEAVEWAVKMLQLPDGATLLNRLRRGEVDAALMESLARRVAAFHARAEGGDRVAAFGRFEVVAGNARENFAQAAPHVGVTVSRAVHERLRALTEEVLSRLRALIEDRARRGVPRDTHGDLHLDHVYLFPDRPAPDDLIAIDCIEFNERFRYADPVADMAFLAMDLTFRGRRDLAAAFADAYFRSAGDEQGRALLPFYVAYRAAVRGKVEGMEAAEPEVPAAERVAALRGARAHWLLALGELEEPSRRPCLVLVAGLPGTGKSTLARGLAEHAGFTVIRSDVVRKELAGVAAGAPAPSPFGTGLYTPEWTERTYGECLRRAEAALFEGKRVVVDASFGEEARRRAVLDAAARRAVPGLILFCAADPPVVRGRLGNRRGDSSDADWSIYLRAVEHWQAPSPATRLAAITIPAAGPPERTVAVALRALRSRGLLSNSFPCSRSENALEGGREP